MSATTVPERWSIKDPIPEIYAAYSALSDAVDAHLTGDHTRAEALFRETNSQKIWNWLNPEWSRPDLNVRNWKPSRDTHEVPAALRDPVRYAPRNVMIAAIARDGYRCRYCGIPVVAADIRKCAHALYADAIPWVNNDPAREHAAFQCMWLQFDHVVPHSHGGRSDFENTVVCCALCQFGKDKYTLAQLEITDPRLRSPMPCEWDGLERLRAVPLPSRRTR
jgi:5-methylcytosine-specific restriction endonuclease McrA